MKKVLWVTQLQALMCMGVFVSSIAYAQEVCDGDPLVNVPRKVQSVAKGHHVHKVKRVRAPNPTLISQHGEVLLRDANGKSRPLLDASGLLTAIKNGDTLQTLGDGFTSIRSSDGSRLVIPSNSTVYLKRISQTPIQIELKQGRVENYVADSSKSTAKNKAKTSYQIRTPAVTLSVRGTQFRVQYNEGENVARTAISDGLVAAQRPSVCAAATLLERGDGALVSQQGIKKVPMLPAPDLSGLSPVVRGDDMGFKLPAMDKAVQYHIQAAYDEQFLSVVKEGYSKTPDLKLGHLDSGFYFVRFTAIDANGIEGFASSDHFLYQPDTPY